MSFKAGGGPPGMREISLKIAALARGIAPNVSQARLLTSMARLPAAVQT